MEVLTIYTQLVIAIWLYMTFWFVISSVLHRNDVADIAWGLGFLLIAALTFRDANFRSILINTLITIWALRLAVHIAIRNRKKSEDYRYAGWRKSWGRLFFLRSYVQVYLLQGALMLLIAAPIVISNTANGNGVGVFGVIGGIVWVIGFLFEAIGDYQLSVFLREPRNRGEIMASGLWKYSRHPNYFGEVTQWWGVWIISLSVPFGIMGIIGPLTITFLILFVSGIPLLEKKRAGDPKFEAYKRKTSIFFPLPQRVV